MYKIRCSQLATLIGDCGKVSGKYEWKDLGKMNDAHIKLAIQIYNSANGLFTPADVCTLDMETGKEMEPEAIQMYDQHFRTSFFADYEAKRAVLSNYEASNEYITGTRDFGSDTQTFDCKISTDKNIFDLKKFKKPEINYTIQVNGYGWLYGTDDNYLFNALMNASFGQVKKHVDSKAYVEILSDEERDLYQQIVERNYSYDLLPISKRIDVKPIDKINNFPEIVKARVETMNEWIEKNKHLI